MRVLLSGVQAVADVKTIRDSDERRRESSGVRRGRLSGRLSGRLESHVWTRDEDQMLILHIVMAVQMDVEVSFCAVAISCETPLSLVVVGIPRSVTV